MRLKPLLILAGVLLLAFGGLVRWALLASPPPSARHLIDLFPPGQQMYNSDGSATLVLSNGSPRDVRWRSVHRYEQKGRGSLTNVVVSLAGGLLPSGASTNLNFGVPENGVVWHGLVSLREEERGSVGLRRRVNACLPAAVQLPIHGQATSFSISSDWIGWMPRLYAIAEPGAAHEPPSAAAVRESSETMNPKPESEAPADSGGR